MLACAMSNLREQVALLVFAFSPACEFRLRGVGIGEPTADLSHIDLIDLALVHDSSIGFFPSVIFTTPLNSATIISIAEKPTATFDAPMDAATITALTFTLKQGVTPIAGTVVFDAASNTATFTPNAPLALSVVLTATLTIGAKTAAQVPLAKDHVWTFTTAACSQASVDLRSAAKFAVLAATTITNTGATTVVTGDLGLSPGSAVTGAPTVIGTQHITDAVAMQGIVDLTLAYDDAKARSLCTIPVDGDIGGQTFVPGLYQSLTSLAVTAADVTLDARGDGDAVFIFQIATTLTTAATRKVVLTNGAKAANVYWQVGTAPSLAAMGVFKGNILSHDAVSLGDGVTLSEGRALSLTAAVNLYNNTVVRPAP